MEKISFQNQAYYLTWHASDQMPEGMIKQVSGYVFNADNELLIVKVGDHWTIPGGTPEGRVIALETLTRELREEACVTTKAGAYETLIKQTKNQIVPLTF